MSVEPIEHTQSVNPATWHKTTGTAGISWLAQAFARIATAIKTRRQQRIDRDAFQTLLTLDDRSLSDIGVTRDEVLRVNRMSISVNAALELKQLADTRRNAG